MSSIRCFKKERRKQRREKNFSKSKYPRLIAFVGRLIERGREENPAYRFKRQGEPPPLCSFVSIESPFFACRQTIRPISPPNDSRARLSFPFWKRKKERKGKNRGRLFDFEFFSNEIEIDPFSRRKFAKKRNEDGWKKKKKEGG